MRFAPVAEAGCASTQWFYISLLIQKGLQNRQAAQSQGGLQEAQQAPQGPLDLPLEDRPEPLELCGFPGIRPPWSEPSWGKRQAAGLWPSAEAVAGGGPGVLWLRARAVGFTLLLGPWSSFFILRP